MFSNILAYAVDKLGSKLVKVYWDSLSLLTPKFHEIKCNAYLQLSYMTAKHGRLLLHKITTQKGSIYNLLGFKRADKVRNCSINQISMFTTYPDVSIGS